MRVLLVRHAQSEWNALGRWQGQADPPLSDAGRQEAKLASETLSGFTGPIFASPLQRARQTAEIISTALGDGTVILVPGMVEIDVGDFSGLTHHEIELQMPEHWQLLQAGQLEAFPKGETRSGFRDRVLEALASVAARHADDEILLVTHGGAIAALERHLGVHPGVGVRNLEGRWFKVSPSGVDAASDRVPFVPDQES